MRILVTGGTGVVGQGVIPELLRAGHRVRLLSRKATDQVNEWPDGVECVNGDVTQAESVHHAAEGCEVVLHVTGIVDETPPEITFQSVNIEGTRNILGEAERAKARRFVFVSSLGADRGKSPYHKSKLEAEQLVANFVGEWVIVRPGHVFGPGDEMVSMVLKMVRASPIVPEVGIGQHRFQPIWFKDFGKALAECVVRQGLSRQTLEVAGGDVITVAELLRTLSKLTYRPAFPLPLPAFLVRGALWAFAAGKRLLPWHASLPLNESKLTMLVEENLIAGGRPNALIEVLNIQPTPVIEALRQLADLLPENPPETGVGGLERKRFWIDLEGANIDSAELMTLFKTRITEVMPIDFSAEPGAPMQVEHGATLSASLPGRGHIQVRVQQCDPERVTFATIEGHPLAGIVTFSSEKKEGRLRFTVETFSRCANSVDWVAINVAGRWFQDLTWMSVAENMAKLSGGASSEGVQHEARTLEGDEAKGVEEWANDLVARRKREQMEEQVAANS